MNSANKVIVCFLGLEYIFPFVLNPFVKNPSYYFKNSPQFQYIFFTFLVVAIIPCFFFNKTTKAFKQPVWNQKVLKSIFFINLCIITFYFLNDLSGSRYFEGISKRENFSLVQGIAQISFEIASINLLLLIWAFLILPGKRTQIAKFFSAQSVFFISGLNVGLAFLYPVFKNLIYVEKENKRGLCYFLLKKLMILSLIGIIFFGAGLFSKNKSCLASNFQNYLTTNYLIDRFSVHLYHASNVVSLRVGQNKKELDNVKSLFMKSIENRNDLLNGKKNNLKDYEKSISGYFNFYFFNSDLGKAPGGGSSIGLLALLCLFLPFPSSMLIGLLVFFVLKKFLTLIFKSLPFCNWLMACAFAYGPLRLFTDDSLLLFNPFESLLISLLIFFFSLQMTLHFKKSNVYY